MLVLFVTELHHDYHSKFKNSLCGICAGTWYIKEGVTYRQYCN
jgi:hypothetical protein